MFGGNDKPITWRSHDLGAGSGALRSEWSGGVVTTGQW